MAHIPTPPGLPGTVGPATYVERGQQRAAMGYAAAISAVPGVS